MTETGDDIILYLNMTKVISIIISHGTDRYCTGNIWSNAMRTHILSLFAFNIEGPWDQINKIMRENRPPVLSSISLQYL